MSKQTKIVTTFRFDKATKNTFRYREDPKPGQPPSIGSLYIQKWAFDKEAVPDKLVVTIVSPSEKGD